jgi:rhamnosyltransferase
MTQSICENISIKDYDICAVVVTFHPDVQILKSLINITLSSARHFVIINNGCDSECLQLMNLWNELEQISLINLEGNFGLAYGINRGIHFAQVNEFSHVILFDQDSIPDNDMIALLVTADKLLRSEYGTISAVGPSHKDPRTGYFSEFDKLGRFYKRINGINLSVVNYLQSSGCLISIDTLRKYGLMDEDLFIHHIDQEWCYRLSNLGLPCFGVQEASMTHIVGDKTITIPFGINRDVHIHSPFRNYFVVRNTIILCKRTYMPLRWKIVEFLRASFVFLFHCSIVKPQLNHFQMMIKGVLDGLLGVKYLKV